MMQCPPGSPSIEDIANQGPFGCPLSGENMIQCGPVFPPSEENVMQWAPGFPTSGENVIDELHAA